MNLCYFFQAIYVVIFLHSFKFILTTDISVCPIRKHKLVSPDLVQMKVLTGALESQQQDDPQKGNCIADGGRTPFASSYPSWLICLLFCFFLVSLSLLVPWDRTCSTYKYFCVSQHSLKCVKWHIYYNTIKPYYKASWISWIFGVILYPALNALMILVSYDYCYFVLNKLQCISVRITYW